MFKKLPKLTSVEILSEWIECEDLARLDMAVASSRDPFLDLLKSPSMSITPRFGVEGTRRTESMIEWIHDRDLKPTTWASFYKQNRKVINLSKVHTCRFTPLMGVNDGYFSSLLKSMPLLTNIAIHSIDLHYVATVADADSISSISILSNHPLCESLFPFTNCRQLTLESNYNAHCKPWNVKLKNPSINVFKYNDCIIKYQGNQVLIIIHSRIHDLFYKLFVNMLHEEKTVIVQFHKAPIYSLQHFLPTNFVHFVKVSELIYHLIVERRYMGAFVPDVSQEIS